MTRNLDEVRVDGRQKAVDGCTAKANELVMYIVVNRELEMSAGKIAAQVGHVIVKYMRKVCSAVSKEFCSDNQNLCDQWIKQGQIKVVLGASQPTMEKLCLLPGVYSIIDEGRTEVPPNSLTALCFQPMVRSDAPKEIRRLQLYK